MLEQGKQVWFCRPDVPSLAQGINQQRCLPEPTSVDPGTLEESERKQRGIKLLSTTLRQALDAFTADTGGPPQARGAPGNSAGISEHTQALWPGLRRCRGSGQFVQR